MAKPVLGALINEIAATGKTFLTILAFIGALYVPMKPYVDPYLDLPETVEFLASQIEQLTPKLIVGDGTPAIYPRVVAPGETVTMHPFLARQASCDTIIQERFYNVQEKLYYAGRKIDAQKAAVTKDLRIFPIGPIPIPQNLPDGIYQVHNVITPIDCGVYRPYEYTPSETFEVRRNS